MKYKSAGLFPILAPFFLASMCFLTAGDQKRQSLVAEDRTPIVGADGVTTEALGIEVKGGAVRTIVPQGTAVPCSMPIPWLTTNKAITLSLYRGTNAVSSGDHLVGRFQVVGVPPSISGKPQVEVTFAVTRQQILLSARDLPHGASLEVRRAQ